MQDSGLRHETKVRYLGVQVGHVSVKEAFIGPLREAYHRARIAATIALSIPDLNKLTDGGEIWTSFLFIQASFENNPFSVFTIAELHWVPLKWRKSIVAYRHT